MSQGYTVRKLFRDVVTVLSLMLLLPAGGQRAAGLDLDDLDPTAVGLNCTDTDLILAGLTCLQGYDKDALIVNCEVQCHLTDNLLRCFDALSLTNTCLSSLASALISINDNLKDILFDVYIAGQCDINVDSILNVCPNITSLTIPDWGPWGNYSMCEAEDNCGDGIKSRERDCLNTISFRPPQVLPSTSCSGHLQENVTCSLQDCNQTGASARMSVGKLLPTLLVLLMLPWTRE